AACGGDDDGGGGGDGGAGGDDGGGGGGPPTAFRITDLDLLDPHAFIMIGACNDVTEVQNDSFQTDIEEDNEGPDGDNPDGLLDLSGLAVFRPLDQSADDVTMDVLLGADCTAPIESTSCTKGDASEIRATGSNHADTPCDVVLADTTNGDYDPAVAPAPAPCSAVDAAAGVLEFGPFQLSEVAGAATYDGDPATRLTNGVLRGFLSEAHADATTVDAPLVGEVPLSSLLPGGTDNCAEHDDRDEDSGGAAGWYVYLSFTAVEVPFTE
ncbi:MAG TPA: hypothetical protein VFU21_01970, partial [Kofleriaceae bacterium]|nr:hypothetical protein [Kofleriaceae bacterium]